MYKKFANKTKLFSFKILSVLVLSIFIFSSASSAERSEVNMSGESTSEQSLEIAKLSKNISRLENDLDSLERKMFRMFDKLEAALKASGTTQSKEPRCYCEHFVDRFKDNRYALKERVNSEIGVTAEIFNRYNLCIEALKSHPNCRL